MRRLLCSIATFCSLTFLPSSPAQNTSTTNAPKIEPSRVAAHVKVLASDAFEGRAPGTAGEKKTVEYITKQLSSSGVQPGGDIESAGGRRWTQDVPLARSDI